MDVFKCAMLLTFFGISLILNINHASAAPVDNETELMLMEEIKDLKNNLSDVWTVLEDYNSRLEHLESLDTFQAEEAGDDIECHENVTTQELIAYEIMGVLIRGSQGGGGDDEEDDEDDDEEEDEDKDKDKEKDNEKDKEREDREKQRKENRRDMDERMRNMERKVHKYPTGQRCQNRRQGHGDRTRTMPTEHQRPRNVTAYCSMRPNKALPPAQRLDVRGKVLLTQKDSNKLILSIKLSGLAPPEGTGATPEGHNATSKHGFHVHQFGNLTNGCESAGPHYNPFNHSHGGPTSDQRHIGDFGNIESDGQGNVATTMEFHMKDALTGPHSLIGKTFVVHAKEDDLGTIPNDSGSMTTGNSGERLACCIIHKLH